MSDQITIFRSPHYQVDFYPADFPTDKVAITFTERTYRNLKGSGFGTSFLIKNGFDVIAVKSSVDHWYQDTPADLVPAVNGFLSTRSVRYVWRASYGSSMAGYAAFTFAKPLQIDAALAISPQFDISGAWDTRWASDARELESVFNVLTPGQVRHQCRYTIAFDPHDKDDIHVRRFAEVIPEDIFQRIAVPYAGHPAGYFLNRAGVLPDLVLSALQAKDVMAITLRLRTGRAAFPNYYFNLSSDCLRRKKLLWARSTIAKALLSDPMNAEYNIRAAAISETIGDLTSAITYAAVAVATNPTHPNMLAMLSRLLYRKKLHRQALYYIGLAIDVSPNVASFESLRDTILKAA